MTMLLRPRIGFKRHLDPIVLSGEGVYLIAEDHVTVLKGEHIEKLAQLLDGTRDIDGVVSGMIATASIEQIGALLRQLATAGVLSTRRHPDQPADDAAPVLAYWETAGLDAERTASRVDGGTLALVNLSHNVRTDSVLAALGSVPGGKVAVQSPAQPPSAELSIVVCDDYLDPQLQVVDEAHRAAGRSWLLVKPVGATVWVGPVFTPGEGCWHCLSFRLAAHRSVQVRVRAMKPKQDLATAPRRAAHPAVMATALSVAASQATQFLAGFGRQDRRHVWAYDSFTHEVTQHEFRARPQCPSCGAPEMMREQTMRPIMVDSRRKVSCRGGGHRSTSTHEVMAAYQHLISPITGVVKGIARQDAGHDFVNSFRAGANPALRGCDLSDVRSGLRSQSGGKGVTELEARTSALCEAIERYSGTYHGDEYQIEASFRSLGDAAVHPNQCLLVDQRQYPDRAVWNATHGPFHHVFRPFDEDAVLRWTPVWPVGGGHQRLLPTEMLYYDVPIGRRPMYFAADSNGCSAGSSIEDAMLQGLLELVERDAVALWWYNRTRQPAVDIDAFTDAWADELRDVHDSFGRAVWVIDVTSDLGIPTMAALSCRRDRGDRIAIGFGAHLDPHTALRRALTELNQMMPTFAGGGSTQDEHGDPDLAWWLARATVENQSYLRPDPAAGRLGPADYGYTFQPDLAADLETIRQRIEAAGTEVLVLDQTRPDVGLPVVRMIAPGLRHFWARFAPGRLYDVPAQLGRVCAPLMFEQLNPIPVFL
jgi:ribosomal protein S12 methylthiotransferase accessory factor